MGALDLLMEKFTEVEVDNYIGIKNNKTLSAALVAKMSKVVDDYVDQNPPKRRKMKAAGVSTTSTSKAASSSSTMTTTQPTQPPNTSGGQSSSSSSGGSSLCHVIYPFLYL